MKKLFTLFVSVLLTCTLTAVAQTEQDFTDRIVNPSFETGDITGWKKCDKGGDHDVRSNGDATYTVSNCDGAYLFNSWYSSNGHLYPAPDQWVEQTVSNLPAGEYRLMALVTSDNGKTPVELYANDASIGCIPEVKTKFVELELPVFIEQIGRAHV